MHVTNTESLGTCLDFSKPLFDNFLSEFITNLDSLISVGVIH